jgi:hypothetical protein
MNTKLYILLALTCIISQTSCVAVLSKMYGMKSPGKVDETDIVKYSKKYNIPLADSYELSRTFDNYLASLDPKEYQSQKKNHDQALQALYYNQSGQLECFLNNCYAGGFPNLKWNRNNILKSFPPLQQAPVDNILSLTHQLNYLQPLSQTVLFAPSNYDYVIVIHWSRYMGRQSKRFIRYVQKNSKLAPHLKIKLIYVNNDDLFAEE